jgi:5'-3' exonuclease
MKRLIIDGNNLVHRVYWVSKIQPKFNELFHVHLFLSSVKNYMTQYKPDVAYCTWDEKVDYQINKRKELLTEYKGNRDQERNVEVHGKNHIIKEILETLGIRNIFPRAYEADDVMPIFHDLYPTDKKTIITVDKDMCQLIDPNTIVFDPIKKKEFNITNFKELIGYELHDFVKLKALAGDKSDNIPGIKGFGKAKIAKVLNGEYTLTPAEQIHFESNLKLVDLSFTLQDTEEVEYVRKQFNRELTPNFDIFKEKCEEHNFNKILKDINVWYDAFFMTAKLTDMFSFLA